jgi:hypothetical protein
MAHTQGPWKAQRDVRHWSNDGALTADSPKAWAVYGPYRVCIIESSIAVPWDQDTEAEDNARLVAAAPATADAARLMLTTLKAIHALPGAAVDCVRGGLNLAAIIAQAEAAGIVAQ